jgi:hypothetical protein
VGSPCYLVNISPSSVLVEKNLHEVWTGKKPSLEHLTMFGGDAYVHVPKENRSKLDNKVEKCSWTIKSKSVSLLVINMV